MSEPKNPTAEPPASDRRAPLVAVTGASGFIGGAVAQILRSAGTRQRLLVRDASRAPQWAQEAEDTQVAVASYGDSDAAAAALEGVEVLFMVSATESEDRLEQHRTLIETARRAGVRHVVYTSFQGAAPEATFTFARTHWATEQALRESGMSWTFLRDSFYADFLPGFASDGVIAGPAGQGRVAAVARADVARSAAAVLADAAAGASRHAGATYELTGPEALTLTEVAQTITERTGTPTRYVEESIEEAYASRAGYGAPRWQVDAWVSTYTAIAAGELATVSGDVRTLTGREPLSLDALLRA